MEGNTMLFFSVTFVAIFPCIASSGNIREFLVDVEYLNKGWMEATELNANLKEDLQKANETRYKQQVQMDAMNGTINEMNETISNMSETISNLQQKLKGMDTSVGGIEKQHRVPFHCLKFCLLS